MEEVQAEAEQVPCVEHRVSPAQAAICCTLAGASKRVVCSHQDKVGTWSSFQAWWLLTLCAIVWSGLTEVDLLIIAAKTPWRLVVEVAHCSEMGLF